ncbi:MAG: hypothetical protein LKKZDAJK_000880 [Candidatus Fervidibacter sp.]
MRREIPAGVAVAVIIVALVVAAGVMWFLMNRPSGGGGTAPKEFMPKPPYARQGTEPSPSPK